MRGLWPPPSSCFVFYVRSGRIFLHWFTASIMGYRGLLANSEILHSSKISPCSPPSFVIHFFPSFPPSVLYIAQSFLLYPEQLPPVPEEQALVRGCEEGVSLSLSTLACGLTSAVSFPHASPPSCHVPHQPCSPTLFYSPLCRGRGFCGKVQRSIKRWPRSRHWRHGTSGGTLSCPTWAMRPIPHPVSLYYFLPLLCTAVFLSWNKQETTKLRAEGRYIVVVGDQNPNLWKCLWTSALEITLGVISVKTLNFS